ncbi:GNAT family N-acetyltransferase [Fodinicola feengrottensis]|uniref:GNAT family N-acetyltransferase n=1 Tax=Fodinicola feengrottensis TaxID=435914 RepID=A0ABP4T5E0_9ACTN
MTLAHIRVEAVAYDDVVAAGLRAELMADLSCRYGDQDGDATAVRSAEFTPPLGVFLVGWLANRPVGCAGWRTVGENAELKRMWVRPEARGKGLARTLLAAVEESARQAGRARMILETGLAQPEAIALYESAGYQRIPDFGHYANEPAVRSYGRSL